jgi:hypothetical protein
VSETTTTPDTDLSRLTSLPADQALALVRQMVRDDAAEVLREQASNASAEDRTIALDLLTTQLGSREQALERLAINPDISDLSAKIAAEKAERKQREDARAQADYAASPAGRREAAAEAAQRREARRNLAAEARELLREEGAGNPALAFGVDGLDDLSDEDVLSLAGMTDPEPEPEPFVQPLTVHEQAVAELRRDYYTLAPYERRERAAELGVDPAEIEARRDPTDPAIFR